MYNLIHGLIHGNNDNPANQKVDDRRIITFNLLLKFLQKSILQLVPNASNTLNAFNRFFIPFVLPTFLFIFLLFTTINVESFAQATSPNAGDFVKNAAYFLVALIGAGLMMVLWLITRFLSFLFRALGGFMYGGFISNPLDTELVYIRPLWSFLVDFGNLLVLASFLALAMVYLFDLKLPVNKSLSQFATGIVIIAIMMNFSLTLTSAIATTIHNIGIGMVFLTIDNTSSAKIDLSSQTAYRKSLMASGDAFFKAINNNFVETLSCTGNAITTYPDGSKKSMAEICQFHKKDKGIINPLGLFGSIEPSIPAISFFIVGAIREMVVLILLATGLSVIFTLLRLSLFRLAYLWLVGVFSGPALIAAVSPFQGMQKYFRIWLNWLITFSTMMIVFIMGFYLSSYIATIVVPMDNTPPEELPDVMNDTTGFVTGLSNIILASVVPKITFPLIAIVILQLLAKYLNDAYKTQAESMLNMAGKMVNEAKKNVYNSTVGAAKTLQGGYVNARTARDNLNANASNAAGASYAKLAQTARAAGKNELAQSLDARAAASYGDAAVYSARAKKTKDNIVNNKDYKEKVAGLKYQGATNNGEALAKLGVSESAIAAEAKKAGVSSEAIQKGKNAANIINKRTGVNDAIKAKESEELQKSNKNFSNDFEKIRKGLYDQADKKIKENVESIKDTSKTIQEKTDAINNEPANLAAEIATEQLKTTPDQEVIKKLNTDSRKKVENLKKDRSQTEATQKGLEKANVDLDSKKTVYNSLNTAAGQATNPDEVKSVTETANKQFGANNPGAARAAAFKASKVENTGNNASEIRSATNQAQTEVAADVATGKTAGKKLHDLSQDASLNTAQVRQKQADIRRTLNSQARKHADAELKKRSQPDDE